MPRLHPLGPLGCTVVAGSLLALAGCGRDDTPAMLPADLAPVPTMADDSTQPPVETVVATVTAHEGQVLVELPLGRRDDLQAGTLLRVYDPDRPGYLKGMLQVVTVADADRSIARQIGLMDRRAPLAVGDPAVVIDNIAELDLGAGMAQAVEQEIQEQTSDERERHDAFAELRRNYRNELARFERENEAARAALVSDYETRIQDLEAAHARALDRREAEHLAELSAIREVLADQVQTGLKEDREARAAEIERLTLANARLQDQVDALATELEEAARQVATATRRLGTERQSHERELRAELETREILEQRIRELEARLGLPGADSGPVLVSDLGREETVLAQLERISKERNQLLRQVDGLRDELAAIQSQNTVAADDPELVRLKVRSENLNEDKARLETRLDALRERLTGLELGRLTAERAYFDLAAGVLRLPDNAPSVRDLQTSLRTRLADTLPAPESGAEAQEASP